jgi:hypothetical protein
MKDSDESSSSESSDDSDLDEEIGSKNSNQAISNPGQKELTLKDDPTDALKIGPGFFESICPEEAGEEEYDHNSQIRGTRTSGYSSVGIPSNPSSLIQPTLQTVSLQNGTPDVLATTNENEELPTRVPTRKRKERKKGPPLTLSLDNCKYDVVHRMSKRFGFKLVDESEDWNLYWTDFSVSLERVMVMKRYQKINHFPGMSEICRKDLLAKNLTRMQKQFPKDYNFFPNSWVLPGEYAIGHT